MKLRLLGFMAAIAIASATNAFAADPAPAVKLTCGMWNPKAHAYAWQWGQTPSDTVDNSTRPLPSTAEVGGNSNKVNVVHHMDALCTATQGSVTIVLSSKEWATRSGEHDEDRVETGWQPHWFTDVSLREDQGLNISINASLAKISCSITAPGIAHNVPPGQSQNIVKHAKNFTVDVTCNGADHTIDPAIDHYWINQENLQIELTILNNRAAIDAAEKRSRNMGK